MKRTLALAGTCMLLAATGLAACARTQTGAPVTAAPPHTTAADAAQAPEGATRPESSKSATPACPSNEALLFACRIAVSGKPVTLCTRPGTPSATTYRFGDPARPELTFTDADAARADAFHRTPLTFAGATGGYVSSFRNGDVTYALYSISSNEGLARAGVAVVNASGRKTTDLQCDPGSVQETESVDLIRHTRDWAPDPATADAIR